MSSHNTEVPEIVLVDKPKGITSFDVIRQLRRKFGVKKMGHAGTLDPLASGLMVIGIGPGTKKLANLIKLDKTYDAEIIIGEQRTTGDMEGDIVSEKDLTEEDFLKLSEDRITKEMGEMLGTKMLPVPIYSAIKRDGEALYKKARRGESVDLPTKPMEIQKIKLQKIEQTPNRAIVFVILDVSSGTYIRSLVEELGRRLGYPATLGNLRRTRVGDFLIKDTIKL